MFKNIILICGLASTSSANTGFKPGKCPDRPRSYANIKKLSQEIDNLLGPWIVAVGQKNNAEKIMCHGQRLNEISHKSSYLLATSLSLPEDPNFYFFDATKELHFEDRNNLTVANEINQNLNK
jgi:hypothetical protein